MREGALFLCANGLSCVVQEFISDGKAKNECGTRVSLPLLEGKGDRVAVEGVKSCRKTYFFPALRRREAARRSVSGKPRFKKE